ncbi:MAG: hypothetical protein VYC39_00810 [Myxococcota bacterium]|nr:hypothetical protein [Myxococcota bacterium]
MSEKPSYTRLGFNNWLNYAFLAGTAAFTIWKFPEFGYTPLMVAGALETAWLTLGVRTGAIRRYLNFVHRENQEASEQGRRKQELRGLNESERIQFLELEKMCDQIDEQIKNNSSLSLEMVGSEKDKIDNLLQTYLRLAKTAARFEHYVETTELSQIEDELRRQEKIVESADEVSKEIANKNRQIIQQRLDRAIDVRKQIREARGQLNLIENTIRLLRDQILTMSSSEELIGQLDELTRTINAIEAADAETRAVMNREMATL